MLAPIRFNSATCIYRCGKTFSVTTLIPSVVESSAHICACMSVGNPGYGSVASSSGFATPFGETVREFVFSSTLNPQPVNALVIAVRCFGSARLIVTAFPAIAPATKNVPASIRSGIISCSAPCNSFTPSIIKRRVPAPSIFAPILFRKSARSQTSGSAAAPSITVVPSARTAAIITLSVPRTVGPNFPRKLMTAPFNFGAKTLTSPPSTRTAAPRASNPFRCKSIGRSPMTQPPGRATVASLHRPKSGPSTQTDARILRTTS